MDIQFSVSVKLFVLGIPHRFSLNWRLDFKINFPYTFQNYPFIYEVSRSLVIDKIFQIINYEYKLILSSHLNAHILLIFIME